MAKQSKIQATERILAILSRRGSHLASLVGGHPDVRALPRHVREKIIDELGEEFAEKGLQSNGEPNAYGLEIEELTDACDLASSDDKS